jgi:uncharacterized protein YqeY
MKSRDSLRVDTLRLVCSEIKNKEIDLQKELEDDEVLSILTTQIKRRKEAALMFEKGGRSELKEKEEKEITIIQPYLPEQVGEEELKKRIQEVAAEVGAEGPKDMGKVMKPIMAEFKGKADGSLVKNLVGEILKG